MSAMIAVVETKTGVSMSSREVAELTGKRHGDVLRDIRKMLSQLYAADEQPSDLQHLSSDDDADLRYQEIQGVTISRDHRNYIAEICLDQDHTLTLLTGYDAKARMRVIRRWQELETQASRHLEISTASQNYWKSVRYDLASSYNKMIQIIEAIARRDKLSEEDTLYMKWREADLLNLVVMGMTSADIRRIYDIRRPIRNSFPNKILMAYHVIENHNISMLVAGVPFETRKAGLEYLLGTEFPDVIQYRNTQMAHIEKCIENRDWSVGPTHPKDWPSMRIPNELMLRYNILPEELEASAQLMLEGEY
jgi:phage regulator Rha-like protein